MYRTTIENLDIDFLHIRSNEPNATPLIMTHGWPGSILEFRKVIGPLTDPAAYRLDPAQAFHLVIPVLPGFGFSQKPTETGWTPPRIAKAWITLMDRLGYERWGAQGGDLGCAVTDEISKLRPAGLIGTHLNFAMFPPTPDEVQNATPEERAALADAKGFWDNLSGYAKEQSTRPQTIGYSLADSPVGQAAWIYAMFQDTCGTPGDAEGSFTLDEMLDNIMLYWLPNSGASAARIYWEMDQSGWSSPATIDDPINIPSVSPCLRRRRCGSRAASWIAATRTSSSSMSPPRAATSSPSNSPTPSSPTSAQHSRSLLDSSLRPDLRGHQSESSRSTGGSHLERRRSWSR